MHDAIEARLAELRAERERGEEMLADLQARAAALRETLLRISGAIQVLEEIKGTPAEPADDAPPAGTVQAA
jgi:hypothetical protein